MTVNAESMNAAQRTTPLRLGVRVDCTPNSCITLYPCAACPTSLTLQPGPLPPCRATHPTPTCGTVRLPDTSRTICLSAASVPTLTSAYGMPAAVNASLARLQYGHAGVDKTTTDALAGSPV